MKLKNFLLIIVISIFSSLIWNLYTNIKINELSTNLSIVNQDIIELETLNKDLSSPYKIDSELVEIEILGTLGK